MFTELYGWCPDLREATVSVQLPRRPRLAVANVGGRGSGLPPGRVRDQRDRRARPHACEEIVMLLPQARAILAVAGIETPRCATSRWSRG